MLLTIVITSVKAQVEVRPDEAGKKVDILFNGQLFTSYIYPDDLEKPVLYPIYTAKGTVITRGFPRDPRPNERVDHPHHVGLWFNFGDVNGLDFWNNSYAIPAEEKSKFGSVKHRQILKAGGGEQGTLEVKTGWIDSKGQTLLEEQATYVFKGEGNLRIIERTTLLTAKKPVTFTDNKEGLIAIRMDRAFEEPAEKPAVFLDAHGRPTEVKVMNNEGVNGIYRNSEGQKKEEGVWGKPARWVSLSAEKNGEPVSVAIIDHKDNPGYPAHSHARGYGLFASNNMGSKVFDPEHPEFKLTLQPGESVTFRHRVIIKSGSFISDGEMNEQFKTFNRK